MEHLTPVTPVTHSRKSAALPLVLVAALAVVAMIAVVAAASGSAGSPLAGSTGNPNAVLAAAAADSSATARQAGPGGWHLGPGGFGPGDRGPGHGMGRITITAINGSQLSLKTDNGWTRTIDASGAEAYRGETQIALADLRVGDQVAFREVRASDGTTEITRIQVLDPSVAGTVTGLTDTSVTVRLLDGTSQTIQTTAATTYRLGRETSTRAEALVVGNVLHAIGTRSGDTFTATAVVVKPAVVAGEVTAKTATTITVTDAAGDSQTINVSSTTTYRIAGDDSPSLDDIAVGDRIAARGQLGANGALDATVVAEGRLGDGGGPGGRGGHRGGMGGHMNGFGDGDKDADPNASPAPSSGTGSGSGASA